MAISKIGTPRERNLHTQQQQQHLAHAGLVLGELTKAHDEAGGNEQREGMRIVAQQVHDIADEACERARQDGVLEIVVGPYAVCCSKHNACLRL